MFISNGMQFVVNDSSHVEAILFGVLIGIESKQFKLINFLRVTLTMDQPGFMRSEFLH
jgi:hypothetical protein